jgi:hypothetical protein
MTWHWHFWLLAWLFGQPLFLALALLSRKLR